MKFRFEVLSSETNHLADKAEVTVVLWITPNLGGLQIERQAGVMRMYADEMRALENVITDSISRDYSVEFEFDYTPS